MIIIEEIWGFWNLDHLSALVHQPAYQFTSLNDHNIISRLRIRVYKIFSMCYEILLLLREHLSRQARLSRDVQFVLNNLWLELVMFMHRLEKVGTGTWTELLPHLFVLKPTFFIWLNSKHKNLQKYIVTTMQTFRKLIDLHLTVHRFTPTQNLGYMHNMCYI